MTPLYNLVPQPGQAGLLGLRRLRSSTSRSTSSSAPGPTATTASTPKPPGSRQFSRSQSFKQKLWGVPARRSTTRCGSSKAAASPPSATGHRQPIEQPGKAVPLEPDDLRRAADLDHRHASATTTASTATTRPGRRRPAATSSASTQSSRETDDRRRPTPPRGLDVDPHGSAARQPGTPIALGDQGDHGQPARRASRSTRTPPTARSPARTREAHFGTTEEAQCPEFSKVGTDSIDQLGAAGADLGRDLPRRSAARQSLPDLPHRRRLRAPTSSSPGSAQPRPADRPADGHLRRPAADAADRIQPPLLRLRARPAGDADPVRHLRGQHRHSCRGRPTCRTRPRPSSSRSTPGPAARPAPAPTAAIPPELPRRRRDQRRRHLQPVLRQRRPATTATRT